MFSKKTKETAFFIVAIVLLWLIFNRQIRGFFTNISRQLNITPPAEQPPAEQPPAEQPPAEQPVTPPIVRPPTLPAIPKVPVLPSGISTLDRLPWERNRLRVEVLHSLQQDMRRIKSFPYHVAATFPEVIGAGGVVSYLNMQIERFRRAAFEPVSIARMEYDDMTARTMVDAVQDVEVERMYFTILPYFPATNGRGGGDGGRVGGGYFAGVTP